MAAYEPPCDFTDYYRYPSIEDYGSANPPRIRSCLAHITVISAQSVSPRRLFLSTLSRMLGLSTAKSGHPIHT